MKYVVLEFDNDQEANDLVASLDNLAMGLHVPIGAIGDATFRVDPVVIHVFKDIYNIEGKE